MQTTEQAYRNAIDAIARDGSNQGLSFKVMPYCADILAHTADEFIDQLVGKRFADCLKVYQSSVQISGEAGATFDWNKIMPAFIGWACADAVREKVAERRQELIAESMRSVTPLDLEPEVA